MKRRRVNLKFCLADFVYLIPELRSDCVRLSNKYAKIVMHALCSVSESYKQNPGHRTLDLPFFLCYKHIPSLKNLPSPVPNESSPYWFQGNFAASFVFNFCLREILLSALVNRFELRCEAKRMMLLYYEICPCWYLLDSRLLAKTVQ